MDATQKKKVKLIFLTNACIPLIIMVATAAYMISLIDYIEIEAYGLTAFLLGFWYFVIGFILTSLVTLLSGLFVFIFWYFLGATKDEMIQGCYKAHKTLNSGATYKTPKLVKLEQWSWNKSLAFINWVYKTAT